jgi:hypothetical protein
MRSLVTRLLRAGGPAAAVLIAAGLALIQSAAAQ